MVDVNHEQSQANNDHPPRSYRNETSKELIMYYIELRSSFINVSFFSAFTKDSYQLSL